MIFECDKCGYKSGKGKELFGKTLCEFCSFFAPEEKEEYLIYVEEKVSAREIQTFRKQGKFGGIKQKKGMKKKASLGGVTSRAPYGYTIKDNKLIPAENSKEIEEIYTDFLNTSLSLNQFSKKHGFSYNGMKKILTNSIKNNDVSHAYIFSGSRWTWKTSTARILAKALNSKLLENWEIEENEFTKEIESWNFVDLIEIDWASNSWVENVRDLQSKIWFSPSFSRVKIYIIDEVHMLSKWAFNALLKTIEEPPEFVYFILATTEKNKIPDTIISRCINLNFQNISLMFLILLYMYLLYILRLNLLSHHYSLL